MEEPLLRLLPEGDGPAPRPSSLDLTAALEARLVNAWPSLEVQVCDGWLLRFARGYSKRANSASPILPGASLDGALIDHIVHQFRAHNLPALFRLTGLEAPDTDERLAARGFVGFEPSVTMAASIEVDIPIEAALAITAGATSAWVREAAAANGGARADPAVLMEIVSRLRLPAAFATLSLDEQPSAWGFGVAERGFVGLYDIVVAPDLRGLGIGRQLVLGLMAWGRSQGATQAYLQVREENDVARALYASLGFHDAYRYTHRIMPGPAGA